MEKDEKILEKAIDERKARKRNKIKMHLSKKKFWQITTIIFLLMFVWAAFTIYTAPKDNVNYPDSDSVKASTLEFIESEMIGPGVTVQLKNFTDEGCLYKVNLELAFEGTTQPVESYVTKQGDLFFPQAFEIASLNGNDEPTNGPSNEFTDLETEVCTSEDEKPIVRIFSTTTCPHCSWVKETADAVLKEYVDAGKIVAYHWELDTKDDSLTEEVETEVPEEEIQAYMDANPNGTVPTFVLGCKYVRVGNSYEGEQDLEAEANYLRESIDKLLE